MNKPWSVSELNNNAKQLLESNLGFVWVQGEISNLMRPSSGHLYFTIKDNTAQIACVWLKYNHNQFVTQVANGKQWWFKGKVSLYSQRGSYQLVVSYAQEYGLGAKQLLLEQKKIELINKGWLQPEHKQPIPAYASEIALITSASGAAVRDMIKVIKRRMPATKISIYACVVQGEQAAQSIAKAISMADASTAELLLVGRGGGSIEDLWAYNEDPVINAIFQAKTPIITGIGHETDNTLAELVADLRAATPSAAAEAATKDIFELSQTLDYTSKLLTRKLNNTLESQKIKLKYLKQNIKHPQQILEHKHAIINNYKILISKHLTNFHSQQTHNLKHLLSSIQERQTNNIKNHKWQLKILIQELNLKNPLELLDKGYAILSDNKGNIINDSSNINPEDHININTKQFNFIAKIIKKSQS